MLKTFESSIPKQWNAVHVVV